MKSELNRPQFVDLETKPDSYFSAIIESSDDAIISKDLNGVIQSWNRGAERIFGYTPEEVVGKPVTILMPEGRQGEEIEILARIRNGERIDHYETIRKRKDGKNIHVSLTVSPVRDDSGLIIGASKIARDITSQKQAEELQRHFRAIVEFSDDAIISKDLNGIIQSWNRGAEHIFGYLASEVIGKPVAILLPEGREDEEPRILARLRKGERIDHYETIRKRKDGELVNISLTVSPIKDNSGKIIGASKIARNITAQKQAEAALRLARQELARANEDLEGKIVARTASLKAAISQMQEFSYTVSHDLRAPVRAMHGYATAVIEDYGERLDDRGREYLERIVRGSDRMDKLIHDVLIYSRLAQSEIKTQSIDLEKLIRDILHQYPEMQPPHLEVRIKTPLIPVMAHESALSQALSNLLTNAKKFIAPGINPKIEIWTEQHADIVRLWIKDNGIGIKPRHHARLFGLFERVSQENGYEGTGIGLAIVRKALEKMGGTVGFVSDGTNGSSFWIELRSVGQPHTLSA